MFVKHLLLKCTLFSCMVLLGSISLAGPKPKNYDAIVYTNNHRFKGFLQDATATGVTIDYLGQSKFISADSISTIRIKRSSAAKRVAFPAAAIGLLGSIPIYIDGNNRGKLSPLALPVVTIAGTLGGALVGTLINSVISVKRFTGINKETSFKSIQPVLLRYSKASPTRVPEEK